MGSNRNLSSRSGKNMFKATSLRFDNKSPHKCLESHLQDAAVDFKIWKCPSAIGWSRKNDGHLVICSRLAADGYIKPCRSHLASDFWSRTIQARIGTLPYNFELIFLLKKKSGLRHEYQSDPHFGGCLPSSC